MLRDQIIQNGEQGAVGSIRPDDGKELPVPGTYCLGHNRHVTDVGSRMAGGHDQLGGIGEIHRAKRFWVARNAGINLCCRPSSW